MDRQIFRAFIKLAFSTFVIACSDVHLMKVPQTQLANAVSKGSFCVTEPTEVRPVTKVMFIVDKSLSNYWVYLPDGGNLPGTDPGASKRGGAIDELVKKNQDKDYFRWSLVAFLEDYAESYVKDPSTQSSGFSPSPNDMYSATGQLRQRNDSGETPFIEALQMGLSLIRSDQASHPQDQSQYVIIFLSDGIPTVGQSDATIFQLVRDIKSAGQGRVVFNTAFYGDYGSYTQQAKDRLMEMAKVGEGKFVDFNTTSNWSFDEFFEKPTFEPWFLASFLVYNLSASFCLNGQVNVDSDSDGMCDRDELDLKEYGFDPQKRFSFGDGYGDYFHWRTFRYKESLPPCLDRTDEDHDFLTLCEEKYIKNESAPEGIGKNGNPKQFDTDRDGVIDGIETFVFFPRTMAMAMDANNLTETFDGEEPAGYQIAQHRNPLIQDKGLNTSYDSEITPITESARDCYNVDQKKLPLYETLAVELEFTLPGLEHGAGANSVLAYYIQRKQKDPRSDGILRWNIQQLKNDPVLGSAHRTADLLKISDLTFKTYSAPKR